MCRNGDKLPTLLVFVVVTAVLVYLWTVDKVSNDILNDTYMRMLSDRRRFALVSMSTKETSYDHMAMSNKFCMHMHSKSLPRRQNY
jgi:hypothetical protein